MPRKAVKTRNAGTWSEAAYFTAIRSALRSKFRFWRPALLCLEASSRKCAKGRQKKEYRCAKCGKWFSRKNVQIDHIVEVGSLRCLEDLPAFMARLTPEAPEAFQVLCLGCHKEKTAKTRSRASWA